MAEFTTRLGLRKIGGGSSGTIPDEVVDADDVNLSWEKIDDAVGAPGFASTNRPTQPYDGQLIWETDTNKLMRFSSLTSSWSEIKPTGGTVGEEVYAADTQDEAREVIGIIVSDTPMSEGTPVNTIRLW